MRARHLYEVSTHVPALILVSPDADLPSPLGCSDRHSFKPWSVKDVAYRRWCACKETMLHATPTADGGWDVQVTAI
jgi:hypothetical protein